LSILVAACCTRSGLFGIQWWPRGAGSLCVAALRYFVRKAYRVMSWHLFLTSCEYSLDWPMKRLLASGRDPRAVHVVAINCRNLDLT
jgi:hypothetical protein